MSRSQIEECIEAFISKAKGEGSRGGKIIGHTKSGKAVYGSRGAGHSSYGHFGRQDHLDAAALHSDARSKAFHTSTRTARNLLTFASPEVNARDGKEMTQANAAVRRHRKLVADHQAAANADVIGKTGSGKNIFGSGADHPGHMNFTAHDHLDAAQRHRDMERHSVATRDQALDMRSRAPAEHRQGWQDRFDRHDTEAYNHRKNAEDHLNTVRHMVTNPDDGL